MDTRFRTATGLGPDSSFGQLRDSEQRISFVNGEEGTHGGVAEDLGMGFSLDFFANLTLTTIPANTVITSVWVHWNPDR